MVSSMNDEGTATTPMEGSVDLRRLIPKLGLREYWYPALPDKEIGRRKPVYVRMLGEDICLFRGKSGQVAALANACPHRGAMLAKGDCVFKGTITCFYHGFTFDERGECVAAIGEGPESLMPGQLRARAYPTVTVKGVVFIWMGRGEPTPPREGIPDEFFDDDTLILHWYSNWPCNWRPALENVGDAHFRYLHRNSVRVLMSPIGPPVLPQNGRPQRINKHRLRAIGQSDREAGQKLHARESAYQEYYPGVDAKWPTNTWRLKWTWLFNWAERRRRRRVFPASEEWGPGQHLPGLFRQNWGTHMYTRWVVPVEEDQSRVFYFHSTKPSHLVGRIYERLHFRCIHNWLVNQNFSEQDRRGSVEAYHDTPEYLSVSDIQTIAWRRFILSASELESPAEPEQASVAAAPPTAPAPPAVKEAVGEDLVAPR
jgi:phenylpropionate dioxygenase-like ring-hydroxylating dioxygenase large terminal subunit